MQENQEAVVHETMEIAFKAAILSVSSSILLNLEHCEQARLRDVSSGVCSGLITVVLRLLEVWKREQQNFDDQVTRENIEHLFEQALVSGVWFKDAFQKMESLSSLMDLLDDVYTETLEAN